MPPPCPLVAIPSSNCKTTGGFGRRADWPLKTGAGRKKLQRRPGAPIHGPPPGQNHRRPRAHHHQAEKGPPAARDGWDPTGTAKVGERRACFTVGPASAAISEKQGSAAANLGLGCPTAGMRWDRWPEPPLHIQRLKLDPRRVMVGIHQPPQGWAVLIFHEAAAQVEGRARQHGARPEAGRPHFQQHPIRMGGAAEWRSSGAWPALNMRFSIRKSARRLRLQASSIASGPAQGVNRAGSIQTVRSFQGQGSRCRRPTSQTNLKSARGPQMRQQHFNPATPCGVGLEPGAVLEGGPSVAWGHQNPQAKGQSSS